MSCRRAPRTVHGAPRSRCAESRLNCETLPLAVGPGLRYAVLVDAHAADAEGRVRADAANGDLLILSVVVAVARQQAGDEADVVGEVHAERVLAQRRRRHVADRCRHVEARASLHPRGGHHDVRERRGLGGARGAGPSAAAPQSMASAAMTGRCCCFIAQRCRRKVDRIIARRSRWFHPPLRRGYGLCRPRDIPCPC